MCSPDFWKGLKEQPTGCLFDMKNGRLGLNHLDTFSIAFMNSDYCEIFAECFCFVIVQVKFRKYKVC